MNTIKSLAIAAGSAALFVASFAQANTVTPLSPISAGVYGDPDVATLDVSSGSALLELPCSNVTFGGLDYNAENGKFSAPGEQASNLPGGAAHPTAVTLTGTASKCEPDGVCRTTTAYITATLTNSATGAVIGNYAFRVNANGVGERCM